jgi:addiction module RelB/DinJ family antitoxin
MATIQLRTRIDQELKKKGDEVLRELGLDAGAFISMAITQLVYRRGLPFAVTESDEAYFKNEYGLTRVEMQRAGRRMHRDYLRDKKAGKLRTLNGPDDLRA